VYTGAAESNATAAGPCACPTAFGLLNVQKQLRKIFSLQQHQHQLSHHHRLSFYGHCRADFKFEGGSNTVDIGLAYPEKVGIDVKQEVNTTTQRAQLLSNRNTTAARCSSLITAPMCTLSL